MTNLYSTLLSVISVTTVAALFLTAVVFTANAQEQLELSGATDATYDIEVRTAADCDDSDENCEPGTREDSTVTKELDKATPASSDTNVCDGVTCPDGSCAATSDQCIASEVHSDYRDADGDGYGDAVERANYNNTRSNRSSIAKPDVNTDNATSSQRTIREGGQTIDAGTIPDTTESSVRDEDSDGDGLGDVTARAQDQDHNSSQSNKYSRSVFSDIDGNGRPEVTLRASGFFKVGGVDDNSEVQPAEDGEVVCWGRADGGNGRVYMWGKGVCVALAVTENANDTARTRLAALQVRGDEVRAWNKDQRAAWREYQDSKATITPEERLAAKMLTQTQANERIQSIEADDSEVTMRYQTQMRLFGIFPIERSVMTSVSADGEVVVDYPWYRFLSKVSDETTIQNILDELKEELIMKRMDQTTPLLYQ